MKAPTAAELRAARRAAGLTQAQAASLCYRSAACWQACELGKRNLDPAAWDVFKRRASALRRRKIKSSGMPGSSNVAPPCPTPDLPHG